MADCLFCKIASGKIPADKVAESDRLVAFRDIEPQAPTHVLIIPKDHIASLNDAEDAELLGHLLLLAREVAEHDNLSSRGYRVVLNTNAEGGQAVYHLHAHVLGGRQMKWPPG